MSPLTDHFTCSHLDISLFHSYLTVTMGPVPPIATTGLIIFSVLFVVSGILVLTGRVLDHRHQLKMHDLESAPKTPRVQAGNKRPPSAVWTRIRPRPYTVTPSADQATHIGRRQQPDLATKPLPRAPEASRQAPPTLERSYFDADDDSEDDSKMSKENLVNRFVQLPRRTFSRNRLSNLPSGLGIHRGRVAGGTPVVRLGSTVPAGSASRLHATPLEQVARVRHVEDVPVVSTPRDLQMRMGDIASPRPRSHGTESLEEAYASGPAESAPNCLSYPGPG